MLAAASRTIIEPRPAFARYVPDVDRSSDGTTTYEGKRYLYSYRTLPSRGLLLLRARERQLRRLAAVPARPPARRARRGGARRAALVRARALDRPAGPARRRGEPRPRGGRDADAAARGGRRASSPRSRAPSTRWPTQLAASRESERNFLLSVSHELKTPLTAIRGYAEGLAEGAFDADDAARTILVESRRLERLVRDLLDLARMNRHEFAVRREPVDLAEVAREAVARHEARAREFGVDARREGGEAPGSRPTTTGCCRSPRTWSRTRCARRRAAGSVTVSRRARRLAVSDTGPGLELDDLAARLRPLLPLRQVRPRASGRQRARARDRQAAHRGDGRDGRGRVGPGEGRDLRPPAS